jgi:polyketide cyclase/dehydrase/lipid transport protein
VANIEQSIDVNVPVRVAYDQWTQFESFPQFMEGVESVRQLDDTHLHWVATIAGKRQEWDAEISEQLPDQRVAWHSTSGDRNAGAVDFHRLSDTSTRITLTMDVKPSDPIEQVGTALGIAGASVKGDLERFKKFIEGRQSATGAWRGEVQGGEVSGQGASSSNRDLAGAGTMGMAGSASDLGDRDLGTGGQAPGDPYGTSGSSTVYDTGRDAGLTGTSSQDLDTPSRTSEDRDL